MAVNAIQRHSPTRRIRQESSLSNLLRQSVRYVYAGDTDLLAAKYLVGEGIIYQRHFYDYDVNGSLLQEIHDDGNSYDRGSNAGATERYIIKYAPRVDYPVGLPNVIHEACEDVSTGTNHLISLKYNTYDNWGRLTMQTVYGSDNLIAYTLLWEYDPHGNITMEKDAMDRVIRRQYDENNNLIWEKGPRPDCYAVYTYDFMNRLIKEEEIHDDGIRLVTSHYYDSLSNRIHTAYLYNYVTYFDYDAFNVAIRLDAPSEKP